MMKRGELVSIKGHDEFGLFEYQGTVIAQAGGEAAFSLLAELRPTDEIIISGKMLNATDSVLIDASKVKVAVSESEHSIPNV
ncbi:MULTISPECIES: hypothetical protein [unclassified Vibrio]|uniref:hypothetical protein n=1 Tax=unclassified Vibrio TaxID=2614977 RepID=UPI0012686CAA|nr:MULTISPECIES: hypothetical protein [unclassified Vibrio]